MTCQRLMGLMITPLLAFLSLIGCGGGGDTQSVAPAPDRAERSAAPAPESTETQIAWELRDHFTDTVLATGSESFSADDLNAEKRTTGDGRTLHSMWHRIGDDFRIGVSVYPEDSPEANTGFGMWLRRDLHPTFSWDWFNVVSDSRAMKLQGGGEVAFEMSQVGGQWQLTSIRVISDVVLRSTDQVDESRNVVVDQHGISYRWSCTLRAGTEIPLPPPQ
ncbi:hypothetical protein JXA47_17570 [Candidatus Sumerlaeota bacterium]|nr:hypothetical protein [Candidatus Sumerlaeota bacterium]